MFKWPPKEAQALSKAIQERFKARTPKGRQDHYLRVTSLVSSDQQVFSFSSKAKASAAKKALQAAEIPPKMEIVSKPKLEEGEYISS